MKIGTRMPGFARDVGFEAYAEWLAENDFDAVDTPPLTREIADTCSRLGLSIGTCDAMGDGVLSADAEVRRKGLSTLKREISATAEHGGTPASPCSARTIELARELRHSRYSGWSIRRSSPMPRTRACESP